MNSPRLAAAVPRDRSFLRVEPSHVRGWPRSPRPDREAASLDCTRSADRQTPVFTMGCVPSHVSWVAGRDRSPRGSATKTHATRACFHHNGPVRQCLGLGQAQSQSANRTTPLAKVCHSADLHSINKGNCESVPLIGQFWTVATSAQLPVTL